MCSYYKDFDHTIEECPQLIAKWQNRNVGKKNPPKNPNMNIQNIYVEPREPSIVIVTRGGDATGEDQEAAYGKS